MKLTDFVLFVTVMSVSTMTAANDTSDVLKPCPKSPNCVSSQMDTTNSHYIEPIVFNSSNLTHSEIIDHIETVLNGQKRVTIVTKTDGYLKAEFTSALLRFVDDVEFLLDENKVVQVRSASRIGHSDFGANRKRIEKIRALL